MAAQPGKKLKILAPATSANLGAGFDTLGICLALHNEIFIEPSEISRVRITGIGEGVSALAGNNMFVNILQQTLQHLGASKQRARSATVDHLSIQMHNRIALSRGMGSSSSVIIAAIAAAFCLAGVRASTDEILRRSLAYEPHTDNTAPCLLGGFVISQPGSKPLRFSVDNSRIKALVAVPKARISTAASRKALAAQVSLPDAVGNIARSSAIAAAFASGDYELLRSAWGDNLHQNARMSALAPIYRQIFAALISAGAANAEQISEHFGAAFVPDDALIARLFNSAAPIACAASSGAYFMALSGSGSSFLVLDKPQNISLYAQYLRRLDALEAVHELDLCNSGLQVFEHE